MFFRKEDVLKREVAGVPFEVLARGEKAMISRFEFEAGDEVPLHSHPHTQCGYVASGRGRMSINGKESEVVSGDSYYIAPGLEHGLVALEKTVVVDFFTPPREDYL